MKNLALQCFGLLVAILLTIPSNGQDIPKCRTYDALDMLFLKYPHLRDRIHDDERELEDYTEDYVANRAGGDEETYVVPVVFHIFHENGVENISDAQVYNSLEILNRDFAMQNEDIEDVVSEFTDVVSGDIKIEFKLAKLDPDGNCTNGILRIESDETNEGGEDMKDESRWPRDMYLNIWVCAYAQGAAGYSYLPASVNSGGFGVQNDGIVLLHDYTGSIGTSNAQRSRTLTHEVGHWLNLRHPWGGTNSPAEADNCFDDDNVEDTPLTIGWQACNLSGESCGSLDNVQNYMEYSYCTRMFTAGQKNRMRAALTSITADRNELWTEENLAATGVLLESALCQAVFTASTSSACEGDFIQFEDFSYNNPTEWIWDFGDGTTLEGEANPMHVYTEAGVYDVTLTVGNGEDEVSSTSLGLVTILDDSAINIPLEEGFENYANEADENGVWTILEEVGTFGWDAYDNTSYSGEQCLRIRNHSNFDLFDEDELVSSTFDFTGASEIVISYKWAFAQKIEETDDRLRIYISNDCGETWSQKKLHRGFTDLPTVEPQSFQFIPNGQSEWSGNTIIIDDEDYFSPSFRVKFRFQNFGGGNIYLDDINIGTEESLSIDESTILNAVNLFPNPSNGSATLDLGTESRGELRLNILDTIGRLVGSQILINRVSVIDYPKLSAGIYIIEISDGIIRKRIPWVIE